MITTFLSGRVLHLASGTSPWVAPSVVIAIIFGVFGAYFAARSANTVQREARDRQRTADRKEGWESRQSEIDNLKTAHTAELADANARTAAADAREATANIVVLRRDRELEVCRTRVEQLEDELRGRR